MSWATSSKLSIFGKHAVFWGQYLGTYRFTISSENRSVPYDLPGQDVFRP